jgi:hypothetical protein
MSSQYVFKVWAHGTGDAGILPMKACCMSYADCSSTSRHVSGFAKERLRPKYEEGMVKTMVRHPFLGAISCAAAT